MHITKTITLPAKKKESGALDFLLGKRIVVQERGGTLVEGVLEKVHGGFLFLADAVISGRDHVVDTPSVLIDRSSVQHVHPAPNHVRVKE
jgi:hypothetical protein